MVKICVYAIAKDEIENVHGFMSSCEDADIVVVGIGSEDESFSFFKRMGATVVVTDIGEFAFDKYRNYVLDKIPHDVDVCISLDLDERLPVGWRKLVEDAWKPGVTRLNYWLQWANEYKFQYDRIHARHGYRWFHPNHECVECLDPSSERVSYSTLTIDHRRDNTKDRSKNITLLETAVGNDPSNQRMLWYLGREYYMLKKYDNCILTFMDYHALNPQWRPEVCWASIYVAKSYEERGDKVESEVWFHAAVRQCPGLRDPLYELAQFYVRGKRYDDAIAQIELALKINSGESSFFQQNRSYTEDIYILMASACNALGDKSNARIFASRAFRVNPDCQEKVEMFL